MKILGFDISFMKSLMGWLAISGGIMERANNAPESIENGITKVIGDARCVESINAISILNSLESSYADQIRQYEGRAEILRESRDLYTRNHLVKYRGKDPSRPLYAESCDNSNVCKIKKTEEGVRMELLAREEFDSNIEKLDSVVRANEEKLKDAKDAKDEIAKRKELYC